MELPAYTPLVGREEELTSLSKALETAKSGKGRTIFLSGEAGIGKTRLLNEMRNLAAKLGIKVMSGICFAENLTPYIAYVEAFKEGGLEHLFAEEAVRVETLYFVDKTGVLIAKAERTENPIDPDIFSGMLTAVESFVRDSLKTGMKDGALNVLGYAEYCILIEQGPHANIVAILTGKENEFLVKDMKETLAFFEEKYGSVLENWSGEMEPLEGSTTILEGLLHSEKYDGLDPAKADPEVRRNRLFENVALGLINEANRNTILLCLDDLQWADPSTLALTHYVSRNARESRLLIVGTFRSEDIIAIPEGQKHPLVETLQLMSREDLHESIEVRRLGPEHVRTLITNLLGKVEFPEDFDPGVFKESGGNPFYILELTRMMVADGILLRSNGMWRFNRPLGEIDVPRRIQDIITRRLQRVSKDDRDLLDVASVIGESFDIGVLGHVIGKERIAILKALRPLESTHRLVRAGDEGYGFDHAKVREVLYVEMPEQLRREYHGMIGSTIEQIRSEDLDSVVADLAYHFYQARNRLKGVKYAVSAGDQARHLYANDEAMRFYAQALELMGSDSKWLEQRMQLLELSGDLQELIGKFDGALHSYTKLIEAGPSAETRARMHRKIGAINVKRGDYKQAEEELHAAEAALVGHGSELGRVRLWEGRLEHRRGDHLQAAQLLIQAAREVEGGDALDRAEAQDSLAFVHWVRQEIQEARQYWEKSIQIRRSIKDEKGLRSAYNNLANTYAATGDLENAAKYYHESLRIAQKIGDSAGATRPLINLGRINDMLDRHEDAIDAFNRALRTSLKIGDQRGVASVHRSLAVLHDDRGQLTEASEHYEKALQMSERIDDRVLVGGSCAGIGSIKAKKGDFDDARNWYERALEQFRKANVTDDIVYTLVTLGWLDIASEKVESTIKRLQEAEAMHIPTPSKHIEGALFGLRGAVARRTGGDAETLLKKALECLPKTAGFEISRVQLELGEHLHSKNDSNAVTLLQQALSIAEKIGDTQLAARVQGIIGQPPPKAS